MRRFWVFAGMGLLSLLGCSLVFMPQLTIRAQDADPTAQQATIDAVVADRLTATAVQQATAAVSPTPLVAPTLTPVPTLTLMPTPITADFQGTEFGSLDNAPIITIYDVDDDVFAAYQEGWRAFWDDDLRDAEGIFEDLVDDADDFADAYISLAITQIRREDEDDALDTFEDAADLLDIFDAGTLGWLITAQTRQGEYEEAIVTGEQLLARNPYDIFGLASLIEAYLIEGEPQLAADTATQILAYDPAVDFIYELRGFAHADLNNDAALEFDTLMVDALDEFFGGDNDDALDELEDALEVAQDDNLAPINEAFVHWNIARIYLGEDDLDAARDALDEGLAILPDFGPLIFLQAITFQVEGDFDAVIDTLEEGIVSDPTYSGNYYQLALFYELEGDNELAAEQIRLWAMLENARILQWDNYDPDDDTIALPFYEGWQHRLPIDLETGDELTITVEDDTGTSNAGVEPTILLLDPDGNAIAVSSTLDFDVEEAEIDNFDIEADGIYTIVLVNGTGASFGGIMEVDVEID